MGSPSGIKPYLYIMKITYHLFDNGGCSTEWDLPIKLKEGTIFLHEFGSYVVERYEDETTAICERVALPSGKPA